MGTDNNAKERYWLNTCSYREYRPEFGVPVRISLGVPKFSVPGFDPKRWLRVLTPQGWYFRANKTDFDRNFYNQLHSAGVDNIHNQLQNLSRYHDREPLVLLCFEKLHGLAYREGDDVTALEAQFCHRRMFALWWRNTTGELIPELGGTPRLIPSAEG